MRKLVVNMIAWCWLLTALSCGITDRDQPVPYYLDLKDVVVLEPNSGIPATHKITDVWVFTDNQIQGVYPLPAKVPIQWEDKETEIVIIPGIRNNGMNDTPVLYPFLESIELTMRPEKLESYTIPLTFRYRDDCKFPVNEGFEDGNIFSFYYDPDTATKFGVTGEESRTGAKSATITLSKSGVFTEVGTATQVIRGQNLRGRSYVEFDYKGEGEIAVGIAKTVGTSIKGEYVLYVPARSEWNRIYVDLTNKTSPDDYDTYRLILGFTKTGFSAESKIYIDNFKHIHF